MRIDVTAAGARVGARRAARDLARRRRSRAIAPSSATGWTTTREGCSSSNGRRHTLTLFARPQGSDRLERQARRRAGVARPLHARASRRATPPGTSPTPRERSVVRVRFVALGRTADLRRSPARRFAVRVSADARRVRWRLGRRSGIARPGTLVLRAPRQKGQYTLVVSARGACRPGGRLRARRRRASSRSDRARPTRRAARLCGPRPAPARDPTRAPAGGSRRLGRSARSASPRTSRPDGRVGVLAAAGVAGAARSRPAARRSSSAGRGCSPSPRWRASRSEFPSSSATRRRTSCCRSTPSSARLAVALGWQLLRGDERVRELGPIALPLAALVGWSGLSLLWSDDVREGSIFLLAFVLPFGLLAIGFARLPWARRPLLGLYGGLILDGGRVRLRRPLPVGDERRLLEPDRDRRQRLRAVLPRQLGLLGSVDLRPLPRRRDPRDARARRCSACAGATSRSGSS